MSGPTTTRSARSSSALATLLVLLPFVESRTWSGGLKWTLLVPAALLGVLFVRWERGTGGAAGNRWSIWPCSAGGRTRSGQRSRWPTSSGSPGCSSSTPSSCRTAWATRALQAGLASTPFALGSAVAAWLGGRVVTRIGWRLVAAGLVLVIVGLLASWVAIGLVDSPAVG